MFLRKQTFSIWHYLHGCVPKKYQIFQLLSQWMNLQSWPKNMKVIFDICFTKLAYIRPYMVLNLSQRSKNWIELCLETGPFTLAFRGTAIFRLCHFRPFQYSVIPQAVICLTYVGKIKYLLGIKQKRLYNRTETSQTFTKIISLKTLGKNRLN